jgi:hypothetical protein
MISVYLSDLGQGKAEQGSSALKEETGFCCLFVVLGVRLGTPLMPSKYSTTEQYPHPGSWVFEQ